MDKWKTDRPELNDKIDNELLEYKKHEEYPIPEIEALDELKVVTEAAIKLANWETSFLKKFIDMFDQKAQSFFE